MPGDCQHQGGHVRWRVLPPRGEGPDTCGDVLPPVIRHQWAPSSTWASTVPARGSAQAPTSAPPTCCDLSQVLLGESGAPGGPGCQDRTRPGCRPGPQRRPAQARWRPAADIVLSVPQRDPQKPPGSWGISQPGWKGVAGGMEGSRGSRTRESWLAPQVLDGLTSELLLPGAPRRTHL